MTAYRYRVHGLTVRSDLALPASVDDFDHEDVELLITRAEPGPVPDDPPPGRIIARGTDRDGSPFCTATIHDGRPIVRYHHRCEFAYSPDLSKITWRTHPGVADEAVSIMAVGAVISVGLILAGHLVLHASAVALDGRAIAFVGGPGRGKSTLATLFCRSGCQLVSDDVLRVDNGHCFRGTDETRLRAPSAHLAEGPDIRGARETADGRVAVQLDLSRTDLCPIGAVVVPSVERGGATVSAERLCGVAAARLLLTNFHRIPGWQDAPSARRQFELITELATTVPVWRCRIPWGPPFRLDLPAELMDAVGFRP